MKRIVGAIIVVVGFALSSGPTLYAERSASESSGYTSAQIKKMVREAHTVEQYTALADYYAVQERIYKQKAKEEMRLWAERSAVVTPLSEKWPRPVDSARNLHDYYEYKAAQSAALFAKYDRMADAAAAK